MSLGVQIVKSELEAVKDPITGKPALLVYIEGRLMAHNEPQHLALKRILESSDRREDLSVESDRDGDVFRIYILAPHVPAEAAGVDVPQVDVPPDELPTLPGAENNPVSDGQGGSSETQSKDQTSQSVSSPTSAN